MSVTINEANKYIDMHERDDNKALKKLLGFNPAKTAWCAGFVNAIEKALGRKGTGKLNARSYRKYGTKVNKPQPGDIVVLKRGRLPWQGHVGYFVKEKGDEILILGGNQNNMVCQKYYPKNRLLDYIRP